ncbi:CLUMA_CG006978, isoform A [Clunio marinus]|uniref:CLUMA_CG006971, isoform A n=1 Tax=Clunio marinus TaxID=568069 RepID=A0A1J1HZQ0_9DIPT|nr:CLUMA_CG006971, isoform A [Clunio marinus]CRK93442.1 CLUMA_CG006978, isoform A [Clunio marinus]
MSASSVRQKPSDDAFYENLTLGLIKVLSNIPRITNINYDKRNPAERNSVNAWESRHNVILPPDMKAFYLCTDGFCLFWSYEYSANDVKRVGKIHIPHLIQITLVRENLETIMASPGNQNSPKPTISIANDAIPPLNLTTKSKIFELSNILEMAKVVMLYETPEASPRIYLLEIDTLKLQFLADTFSEYLRMAIAHLGLPYWELCFSTACSLPTWTQQLFLLLAPHLLENNEPRRNTRSFHNGTDETPPFNTLDPSVFRNKPKSSKTPKNR